MLRPLTTLFSGLICFVMGPSIMTADIVLSSVGDAVTENYNNYRGDGFAPTPASGQLDSDTYRAEGFSSGTGVFGGTHDTGDFARGESVGGVTSGGAYAFEVDTGDYSLGVQPTSLDFTPGSLTVRVANQTGQSITGFQLGATAYFFNDEDRSTRWTFAVSVDDASYTDIFSIDSPQDADANPAWSAIPLGGTIPFPTPLANGNRFFLRVSGDDLGGSGSRDEFALDNLSLTAIPEPSTVPMLAVLTCLLWRLRSRKR